LRTLTSPDHLKECRDYRRRAVEEDIELPGEYPQARLPSHREQTMFDNPENNPAVPLEVNRPADGRTPDVTSLLASGFFEDSTPVGAWAKFKEITAIIGPILSLFSLALSIFALYHAVQWNTKKSSHDTLLSLVGVSRFPELINEFHMFVPVEDWGGGRKTYNDLPENKRKEVRKPLWSILDILEALSINVSSKTIDEDTAYDYMVMYVLRFHHWSKPFIDRQRD
jgi:hypothetical protein